jgi:hypothetical protein
VPNETKTNATSTRVADALSARHPALRFVVQAPDAPTAAAAIGQGSGTAPGVVTLSSRAPGSLQPIKDAAVYVVQRNAHSPQTALVPEARHVVDMDLQAELRAHMSILRSNPSAKLVLIPRLLPSPGALDHDVEFSARLRDLVNFQLTNQPDRDLDEFMGILNTIQDRDGRLVVVNQLTSRKTTMIALGVRYQSYNETT